MRLMSIAVLLVATSFADACGGSSASRARLGFRNRSVATARFSSTTTVRQTQTIRQPARLPQGPKGKFGIFGCTK